MAPHLAGLRWAVALASLTACGPASTDAVVLSRARAAIVGGTEDTGDPAIFALVGSYFSATPPSQSTYLGSTLCSGTLIAPRILLTAAHCVDSRGPDSVANGVAPTGSVTMVIDVNDSSNVNGLPPADFVQAASFLYNPNWSPTTLVGDLGLVLLPSAQTVAPKPWSTLDASIAANQPLRVIGYGITGPSNTDYEIKREVTLPMLNVTADHYDVGNSSNQGICHGDSGGPSLFTFSDGVEREVGVHSFTINTACTLGADTRTDFYQAWIQSYLDANDPATCAADGYCVAGCNPVDPDCVAVGQPCLQAAQCNGRQCVGDPQHPQTYCSLSCASPSGCPATMTCTQSVCTFIQLPTVDPGANCTPGATLCIDNTQCTGPVGGTLTCRTTCTSQAQCGTGYSCASGANGFSYCEPPPVVLSDASGAQGPEASTCASVGAAPWVWLAAAALLRGSRRRRSSP